MAQGIGLFLCNQLIDLMGGEIYHDESYDSGVTGRPGCRFVINLQTPPVDIPDAHVDSSSSDGKEDECTGKDCPDLPKKLSVLFVDDDPILRKLFKRTIRTVAPEWDIREAANGETAIRLAEEEDGRFDLIFLDMYMASTDKQMLGTEAARVLRQMGVDARICGLSANDKSKEFLDAGADACKYFIRRCLWLLACLVLDIHPAF